MAIPKIDLHPLFDVYSHSTPYQKIGKVCASRGLMYEVNLARANLGANVEFVTDHGETCLGEVVRIDGSRCFVMPYQEIPGINSETHVFLRDLTTKIKVTPSMVGRILDFQGNPIDMFDIGEHDSLYRCGRGRGFFKKIRKTRFYSQQIEEICGTEG